MNKFTIHSDKRKASVRKMPYLSLLTSQLGPLVNKKKWGEDLTQKPGLNAIKSISYENRISVMFFISWHSWTDLTEEILGGTPSPYVAARNFRTFNSQSRQD